MRLVPRDTIAIGNACYLGARAVPWPHVVAAFPVAAFPDRPVPIGHRIDHPSDQHQWPVTPVAGPISESHHWNLLFHSHHYLQSQANHSIHNRHLQGVQLGLHYLLEILCPMRH